MKISEPDNKKRKWRFLRCIWHDKVDTLMWLTIIGLLIFRFVTGEDVSQFLFVLMFYVYYFMYRKFTFWQDRKKFWQYLKDIGENVDNILEKDDY